MTIEKLNPMRLGVSLGILWGFLMFITSLYGYFIGNPNLVLVQAFQDYYMGYNTTPLGAVLGFIWGFIDCFFVGIIWAYVFNCLGTISWIRKWD